MYSRDVNAVTSVAYPGGAAAHSAAAAERLFPGDRELVSLESPVYWPLEGARQVEVPVDGDDLG